MTLNSRFADYTGQVGLSFPTRWSHTSRGFNAAVPDTFTDIAPAAELNPALALNFVQIGAGVNPGEVGAVSIIGFGTNPATYTSGDPMRLVSDTLDANTPGVPSENHYVSVFEAFKTQTDAIADIPLNIGGGIDFMFIGAGTRRAQTSLCPSPPLSIALVSQWTLRALAGGDPIVEARLKCNHQSFTNAVAFDEVLDTVRDVQPGETVVRRYDPPLVFRHNAGSFQADRDPGGVWAMARAGAGLTASVETTISLYSTTQRQFLESGT